jgi:hypothetical protein
MSDLLDNQALAGQTHAVCLTCWYDDQAVCLTCWSDNQAVCLTCWSDDQAICLTCWYSIKQYARPAGLSSGIMPDLLVLYVQYPLLKLCTFRNKVPGVYYPVKVMSLILCSATSARL